MFAAVRTIPMMAPRRVVIVFHADAMLVPKRESEAATLSAVIQEMLLTTTSERQGRTIDHDQAASMEKKKQEGYF